MDLISDVVTQILDLVVDTRTYACVSRLAAAQCSARPDHARWQRIRSLNDYFVHGSRSIVVWALENVPALAALDAPGLTCALANAFRADNREVVNVLDQQLAFGHVWLADKFWWQGYKFHGHFGERDHIAISKLPDKVLIQLLSDAHAHIRVKKLLGAAAKYGRRGFALELVRRYGQEIVDDAPMIAASNGYVRLVMDLAEASCQSFREEETHARHIAIYAGRVDELDNENDRTAAAEMLDAAFGRRHSKNLSRAHASLYPTIAANCSDEVVQELLGDQRMANQLLHELAVCGRVKFLDRAAIVDGQPEFGARSLVFHENSVRWAASAQITLYWTNFIESTVDLYLLCRELGGLYISWST